MNRRPRGWWFLVPVAVVAMTAPSGASVESATAQKAAQSKKPSIKLKANPTVGMSPFRVVVTAEVTGGSDDFEDFYCASVEWDWGDGTTSQSKEDCDPYEAGKSQIKRRYTQEHTYRSASMSTSPFASSDTSDVSNSQQGVQMRIRFMLKQKNKTVGSSQTTVQVRPGLRDGME
jgi:hypothetical protein